MEKSIFDAGISLFRNTTNLNTYTRTNTHQYMYAHTTPMNTSKRLSRFDLEIYKVGHQERLAVNEDVVSH
jgi:hypothetical protein